MTIPRQTYERNDPMTNQLITISADSIDDSHFPLNQSEIRDIVEECSGITCSGIDDKHGLSRVNTARLRLKATRVDIEKRRKELKAGALEFGRKVDAVAKHLKALIEPTEQELKSIEDSVAAEIERIETERVDNRMQQLAAVESSLVRSFVKDMSEDQFEAALSNATEQFRQKQARELEEKIERDRIEKEQREQQRIEAERIKTERENLRKEQEALAKQKEEQQAAEQERLRIETERREAEEQKLREERQKIEAERRELEEQLRRQREAEERAEREAAEKLEAAERAKYEQEERLRIEAMRPDREKLLSVVDLIEAVDIPAGLSDSEEVMQCVSCIKAILSQCAQDITDAIDASIPKAGQS